MLHTDFGPYKLAYRTKREIRGLIRDVRAGECDFTTSKHSPLIIDCGAHIGVMTLWFKWHHPGARIICFEPNPETFLILKDNIENNNIQDVALINAAVSDFTGTTTLYGVMGSPLADTRGNSIVQTWGERGKETTNRTVNCVKLSDYITEEVDFLKIDVEGAEKVVLSDIREKLRLVNQMSLEVHQTDQTNLLLYSVKNFLRENNFQIQSENHRIIANSLPPKWGEWVEKTHPKLITLKVKRTELAENTESQTITQAALD